jgi:hypothetical protein
MVTLTDRGSMPELSDDELAWIATDGRVDRAADVSDDELREIAGPLAPADY